MTNPLDTLVARYRDFRAQGGEILGMRREVSAAQYQVKQRPDPDPTVLAALDAQAQALDGLYREWVDANDKVQAVVGTLRSLRIPLPSGLGVVPVVLPLLVITAIAGAVTAMVLVGGKVLAQRQLLKAVKDRLLTPAEAAAIGKASGANLGGFFSGMGVTGLAVLAVVAFLLLRRP